MRGKLDEFLSESKKGSEKSKLELLKKYKPLIMKAAFTYYIKGYENEDLIQMANLWFLKAIDKYDIGKNSNFSAYAMRTIHNNFKSLLRKIAKENYEKSIYEKIDEELELIDVLRDDFNVEENYEEKELKNKLREAMNKLKDEEKEFILSLYLEKRGALMEWAKKNNISYYKALTKRKYILLKLKSELVK